MSRYHPIELKLPDGRHTVVPTADDVGKPLSTVLRRHGVMLNTRCAGRGLCESCLVSDNGNETFQSCQRVYEPGASMALTVPARSLMADSPQVLDAFALDVPLADLPITEARFAIAVDIGTTTVATALVDTHTRQIVGRASAFNRQIHLGDDVLTRINLCFTASEQVELLRDAVVANTLGPLFDELCEFAEEGEPAGAVVIAGNTTMLHLALGVDPSSMGVAPFTPTFLEHRAIRATQWFGGPHRALAADAMVHLLPSAAAYVGADIVGGVLVSGMGYETSTVMLVDVGTNGEIALHHDGKLTACATAAGPAFEGQGLRSGVRATDGAICNVGFDPDHGAIDLETIGGAKPIGICGSAYIDLLADGRRHGLLMPNGRFSDRGVECYAERIETNAYGKSLRLAKAPGGEAITVTEADIAALLQAKAAIGAGISTLLELQGMKPADVATLHLAGGFGMHLNARNAIDCGLLPGFAETQVERIGNSSLGAAFAVCLDRAMLDEAARLAGGFDVLELNLAPGFEDAFVDHLRL